MADRSLAKQKIKILTHFVNVLSVGIEDIQDAINSVGNDFEDSIQIHVALKSSCDVIITRNTKDYKHSAIPVLTAEQFLQTL